jgi:hypothetical protein
MHLNEDRRFVLGLVNDPGTLAGQEVPSEQVLDKAKAILDSDAEALVLLE